MKKSKNYLREKLFEIVREHDTEGGTYPSHIKEKHLHISRQLIGYHLKKLVADDRLQKYKSSGVTFYRVKKSGSQPPVDFLQRKASNVHQFKNLHNIHFNAKVRKDAPIDMPYKAILNNIEREYGWMMGKIFIDIVRDTETKKAKSVNIRFRIDDEPTPGDAEAKAWKWVGNVILYLEQTFGMELAYPQLSRRPHFTIEGDPVADAVKGAYYSENGHVDTSDEREFETYTREHANNVENYIETVIGFSNEIRGLRNENKLIMEGLGEVIKAIRIDRALNLGEKIKNKKE